jgi:hypothetical protein
MAETEPIPTRIRVIKTSSENAKNFDNSSFQEVNSREEALELSFEAAQVVDNESLSYNLVDSDGVFKGIIIDFIGDVWMDPPFPEPFDDVEDKSDEVADYVNPNIIH